MCLRCSGQYLLIPILFRVIIYSPNSTRTRRAAARKSLTNCNRATLPSCHLLTFPFLCLPHYKKKLFFSCYFPSLYLSFAFSITFLFFIRTFIILSCSCYCFLVYLHNPLKIFSHLNHHPLVCLFALDLVVIEKHWPLF